MSDKPAGPETSEAIFQQSECNEKLHDAWLKLVGEYGEYVATKSVLALLHELPDL